MNEATHRGVGTKLPLEQGLTNYYVNVQRDWSWGAEENAAGLAELAVVLGGHVRGLGRTLVQGAGAPAPLVQRNVMHRTLPLSSDNDAKPADQREAHQSGPGLRGPTRPQEAGVVIL